MAKLYNGKFMTWLHRSRLGSLERRLLAYRDRPQIIFPHQVAGVRGKVEVGEGTHLGHRVRLDGTGRLTIGRHCVFGHGAKVYSHSHVFLSGWVEDITRETGLTTWEVVIGDNVFIGEEAVILPQAGHIGANAVIGTRAVVTRPVGPSEIWAGNPARKIGERPSPG